MPVLLGSAIMVVIAVISPVFGADDVAPPAPPSPEIRFEGLDRDHDGHLTLDEYLKDVVEGEPTEVRRNFCRADRDGDRRLDRDEYVRRDPNARPTIRGEFNARDADSDAYLTMDEFRSAASENLRSAAARDFKLADENRDGRLSLTEFAVLPNVGRPEDRLSAPDPVRDWLEKTYEGLARAAREFGGDLAAGVGVKQWPDVLRDLSPQLAAMSAADWDRDRDGSVSASECRYWLEIANGLRKMDGADLRTRQGISITYDYIRGLDKDRDGLISRLEFVDVFWAGPVKSAEKFGRLDADGDGQLSFPELAVDSSFHLDALKRFMDADRNLDGVLDPQELSAAVRDKLKPLAVAIAGAFDENGDGTLSLYEYRATPLADGAVGIERPGKKDQDYDAKLSWSEFYAERGPFGAELAHHLFSRFDRDHNGSLSQRKFPFSVEVGKLSPQVAFQLQDTDGDGKLELRELFTDQRPTTGDGMALERYEMRLAHAEDRLMADDIDGDGSLSLSEFTRAREAARVLRSASRRQTSPVSYWARKGVVLANAAVMLWVALTLIYKSFSGVRRRASVHRETH